MIIMITMIASSANNEIQLPRGEADQNLGGAALPPGETISPPPVGRGRDGKTPTAW